MAENKFGNIFKNIANSAVAVAAIVIVLMIILPVPGFLLNTMMVINVALSIIILLVVIFTPKSSDLSSFPRVVLFFTIYGLGLNVCSTRYILAFAAQGKFPADAQRIYNSFDGDMIKIFSDIVAGGNLAIGIIIFIIIIVIQVVVITKGATRVSEVAARFALDSMNSKMFAVDSELNSGAITDEQARAKKASIQKESDFYSAMDGSSKFVSGNVKAGIVITLINLIGGLIIASVNEMDIGIAAQTFSRFTIGDGLLSQLPSLLLSFATGVLVTGSNAEELLGDSIKRQFKASGNVYLISGGVLVLLGILFFAFGGDSSSVQLLFILGAVGGLLIFAGYKMHQSEKVSFEKKLADEQAAKSKTQTGQNPDEVSPVVPLDPLSLEIGFALIPLVDKEKGAELLERVTRIRREAALDLGLVVPKIRITDNMTLEPNEYSFKIRGIEAGNFKIKPGYYMCMNTGSVIKEMTGEETHDPAFGMPAIWVSEDQRADAEANGYAVIDPPTIIATHITELIRAHASDILGREEVAKIVNEIKKTNSVVVDEVMEKGKYTYGEIEKVFQGLLREQVSIRNVVTILETLANYGSFQPHDPWFLIEKVREALGLQICLHYVDMDKKLSVIQLSQSDSEYILQHQFNPKDGSMPFVALDPQDGRKWISGVSNVLAQVRERNLLPIILCAPEVRQLVKSSIDRELPGTAVISISEVMAAGHNINLEILGEINVWG